MLASISKLADARWIAMDLAGQTIQDVLIAWGRTRAMHDASHIGYPSRANFAAQLRSSGQATVKVGSIEPELHTSVDSAVSSLKARCELRNGDYRYAVLRLYYCAEDHGNNGEISTLSERSIAKRLKVAREDVKAARQAAESWVESALESGGH